MPTSFDKPYDVFFKHIENDPDFFNYRNLSVTEALELAKLRADDYLKEAISLLTLKCTPDVDFNDYNDITKEFNFDLVPNEILILGSLMFEIYLERDISKVKIYSAHLTSQEIKTIFSPANERKTFLEMYTKIQLDNDKLITKYISKDRKTGKRKKINHALLIGEN
jgi:hypothetical protein